MISILHISKIYTMGSLETIALSDISFEVKNGEFVAIMGPSGSGKSTLMHILGALDKPSHGEYMLDGERMTELDENQLAEIRNKKIGFVFQAFNLLPRMSALSNVMLPMMYAGISRRDRLERAEIYLSLVGLNDRMFYSPNQLSGGQQQRVAIARALVMSPRIILPDEPTGNIATTQAEEIMNIFRKLNDKGHTIIMITHEPDIARHAQRIIHIKDGKIQQDEKQEKQYVYKN